MQNSRFGIPITGVLWNCFCNTIPLLCLQTIWVFSCFLLGIGCRLRISKVPSISTIVNIWLSRFHTLIVFSPSLIQGFPNSDLQFKNFSLLSPITYPGINGHPIYIIRVNSSCSFYCQHISLQRCVLENNDNFL